MAKDSQNKEKQNWVLCKYQPSLSAFFAAFDSKQVVLDFVKGNLFATDVYSKSFIDQVCLAKMVGY